MNFDHFDAKDAKYKEDIGPLPRDAHTPFISAVTLGPSYDNVQMLEDNEGLEVTVTQYKTTPCPLPSPC